MCLLLPPIPFLLCKNCQSLVLRRQRHLTRMGSKVSKNNVEYAKLLPKPTAVTPPATFIDQLAAIEETVDRFWSRVQMLINNTTYSFNTYYKQEPRIYLIKIEAEDSNNCCSCFGGRKDVDLNGMYIDLCIDPHGFPADLSIDLTKYNVLLKKRSFTATRGFYKDITFDSDHPTLQDVWNQVKHLFTVEPYATTYALRKDQIDDGTDPHHWLIKQCVKCNIGFFRRRDGTTEGELDQSGFISLCDSNMMLDLSIFDPKNVEYDASQGVKTATINLIIINPVAYLDSLITPKLRQVLSETFIQSVVQPFHD